AGAWGCIGHDLTDLETNICHGTKILAHAIKRSRSDLSRALLAYHGCVHGTNTPDCHRYPSWVLGNAAPGWANGWEERQWVASAASVGLERACPPSNGAAPLPRVSLPSGAGWAGHGPVPTR